MEETSKVFFCQELFHKQPVYLAEVPRKMFLLPTNAEFPLVQNFVNQVPTETDVIDTVKNGRKSWNPVTNFEKGLAAYISEMDLLSINSKRAILNDLFNLAKTFKFPGDVYVFIVGSLAEDLFVEKSDLDVCLVSKVLGVKDKIAESLSGIESIQVEDPDRTFQLLKVTIGGSHIDLGINSFNSIYSTFLLKTYLADNVGLREMVWFVKSIFKTQKLNSQISSYGAIISVIFALEKSGLIKKRTYADGREILFRTDIYPFDLPFCGYRIMTKSNELEVEDALKLYLNTVLQFKWNIYGMQIRTLNKCMKGGEENWKFFIEEPLSGKNMVKDYKCDADIEKYKERFLGVMYQTKKLIEAGANAEVALRVLSEVEISSAYENYEQEQVAKKSKQS